MIETIRRFDVFAEFNKQKKEAEGYPEDVAKGEGLWLAKFTASRRFGKGGAKKGGTGNGKGTRKAPVVTKFKSLNEIPQTDQLFDKEIVGRLGIEIYETILVKGVRKAIQSGLKYNDIRGPRGTSVKSNTERYNILQTILND
jgi:hypothetical protein